MKKYLFVPFLVLVLFSCEEKPSQIPLDVLPVDKMVQVLIDIHLMEGTFAQKNLPRDTAVFLFKQYEKDLFRKHNISDSTYKKSFHFYSAHPEIMDKIYEQVVDSLSLREGQKRL
jgi:hypothetical protein